MTFISKMLSAIGLYSDPNEYEEETTVTAEVAPTVPDEPVDIFDDEQQMVHSIFDKVLDIVNASLPDFLAKSVDPRKQKQYMFDALDESVKAYILSLDHAARRRCEALWQQERLNLQAEMEKLKDQAKQLEDKRSQLKERQLSADRQKRALSERVHDLEAQVLRLEAEKEQFELENKSLLNKAKVAAVYEKEIEELRSAAAHAAPAALAPDPALSTQISELTAQLDRLKAEAEGLKEENKRLTDACEAAQTKDRMEDTMVDELRKIAAESKGKISELETALQQLQGDYDLSQARLDDANAKIKSLESHHTESADTQAQLEEITAQVERFAEVKDKLDRRISQLKENLQRAQTENESLRTTIKNNLFQHASQEKEMRKELEALRAKVGTEAPQPAKRPRSQAAVDADTSDVEDVLTNNDFLTSAPAPGRAPKKEDPDFGYTPPVHKPRPENKAQMSLFDDSGE